MYAIRVLLVCVAFSLTNRTFSQDADALPEGAILRLGTTKFRLSENNTVAMLYFDRDIVKARSASKENPR